MTSQPDQSAANPDLPFSAGNVYVVDDDELVRKSSIFALRAAGYAPRPFATGQDFLDAMPTLDGGCVILDLRMPVLDGLQVLGRMSEDDRERLPVVVVSGHGDIDCAVQAIKLGAVDFLEKPCAEQVMYDAIRASLALLSQNALKTSGKRHAKALIDRLTPRERDVLTHLLDGKPNKVAAADLGLSVRTVEMHRGNLMDRLGVRSIGEAMRLALVSGAFPA